MAFFASRILEEGCINRPQVTVAFPCFAIALRRRRRKHERRDPRDYYFANVLNIGKPPSQLFALPLVGSWNFIHLIPIFIKL